MTVNLGIMERARWVDKAYNQACDSIDIMTERIPLLDLYPQKDVFNAAGRFTKMHQMTLGQQLLHYRPIVDQPDFGLPEPLRIHDQFNRTAFPHPLQPPRFVLFSGGFRAGKSLGMWVEAVNSLRSEPGVHWVVVNPFDYYFDEFSIPTLEQVMPLNSPFIKKWHKKDRVIECVNGSELRMKAYDEPDKVRGWEADRIWVEEAAELGDANSDKAMGIWIALVGRNSGVPGNEHMPKIMYVTQNPRGHNWVWKVFIQQRQDQVQPYADDGIPVWFNYTEGEKVNELITKPPAMETRTCVWYKQGELNQETKIADTYYTVAVSSKDNPFLPPGYIQTTLSQMADSRGMAQRLVSGKFNPVNILVYGEHIFRHDWHIIDLETMLLREGLIDDRTEPSIDCIPPWWPLIVGIDPAGLSSPWAVEYYAQNPDTGDLFGIGEIYTQGLIWDEIADDILDWADGKHPTQGRKDGLSWEKITYYVDPFYGGGRSGQNRESIVQAFAARGIALKAPRGAGVYQGIQQVQAHLFCDRRKEHPYIDDEWDPEGMIDPHGMEIGCWKIGRPKLFYLKDRQYSVPAGIVGRPPNPNGIIMLANIAEKGTYRFETPKRRDPKESEEGLTVPGPEKVIDKDDHAQRAEAFALLGEFKPSDRVKKRRATVGRDPVLLYRATMREIYGN